MEITVAEILGSDLLKDAKVIAGQAGLYRPVASVTVGEVPDIADWLKGGEVVLSTLYAVSEDPTAQLEFVRKIIAKNAAALFIKPSRFVKGLEKTLIAEAKQADFPLIEVPNDIRWTDLVRDIYDRMIQSEVEIRMKGDLIDDLLAGQYKPTELVRRAGFLGADLAAGCLAMVMDIDSFGALIKDRNLDEQTVQRMKREMLNAATWSVRAYSKASLISLKSDNVIVLLAPPADGDSASPTEAAARLATETKDAYSERYAGSTVSVGIGRFYGDPEQMAKSLEEARAALTISRALAKTAAVTRFDDVGVYKLLLRVYEQAPDDLLNLYNETVRPLVEYDAQHHGDLLTTLEKYLANNTNLNHTAEDLFTHRHTVRYRLERVAAITGLDVDSSDELEKLSLGLKAARLLRGLNQL